MQKDHQNCLQVEVYKHISCEIVLLTQQEGLYYDKKYTKFTAVNQKEYPFNDDFQGKVKMKHFEQLIYEH